jgi:hypothetical protein
MHDFFKYQQKTNAPIDFFSWHVYDNCHESTREDFSVIANHAEYCRKILDRYGYTNAEHHLNEWNLWTKASKRDAVNASAKTLAFMLMMQNTSTDVMCYYDGKLGWTAYGAILNPDSGAPYRTYYALSSFNTLYRLEKQIEATSDNEKVFVGAARDGKKAAIAISNINDSEVELNINVDGFAASDIEIHRIDEIYRYAYTGEKIKDGRLVIPAYGCVEIKLFDLN